MKNHVIIGTAGHIDHGKTAVIRALTGIDADRLKEEKERGITIDIGFAYWKDNVTILDVPGHEKLIRNMVAGVNTIDLFMLVIAADDGIMPQTIEHLDILSFFNIRDGFVVINKTDLVDNEWLKLVKDEIVSLLKKYDLEDIPIVDVSATSGHKIDELRRIIEKRINILEETESSQPFRLLVDRSFIIKGFGTVVTGTVLSGKLTKGDEIQIFPSLARKKVRGLQTHGHDTQMIITGDRAAVNLQGISKEEISRGDVLMKPDTSMVVTEFIGTLRTVSKLPVKIANRARVRIYIGTAEHLGRLVWFEKDKFLTEESTYHVRIKLDTRASAVRKDAYLIRLHSPLITLAGGIILEVNPPKLHYKGDQWIDYFKIMASENYDPIIMTIVNNSHLNPLSVSFLEQKLFEDKTVIATILSRLVKEKKLRVIPLKGTDYYITETSFKYLVDKITKYLTEFHLINPHLPGLNSKEIMTGSGNTWCSPEVFDTALKKLLNANILKLEYNLYSLSEFSIQVSKDIEQVRLKILAIIRDTRFTPPTLNDISSQLDMPLNEIRSIMNILSKSKNIIQINQDIYLHSTVWEELLDFLKNFFTKHDEMPVMALKEYIDTTRKYAIPLFEYLDSQGITERKGDVRLRGHNL